LTERANFCVHSRICWKRLGLGIKRVHWKAMQKQLLALGVGPSIHDGGRIATQAQCNFMFDAHHIELADEVGR
jgi:hypothetical protein